MLAITRRAAPFALAALLGGCTTVGADYAAPRMAAPDAYAARPAGTTPDAGEARWWRSFADPVLDQLIGRALAANLEAKIAVARLDEARALARSAGADRLPGGGIAASHQRRRSDACAYANFHCTPPKHALRMLYYPDIIHSQGDAAWPTCSASDRWWCFPDYMLPL